MRWTVILLVVSVHVSSAQSADSSRLSLLFLGDIMQHDSQIAAAWNAKDSVFSYEDCFEFIEPVLSSADLTIGNLELTLAGPPYKGYPQFSAPDALLTTLKKSGVDVLVTANNHSMDRGRFGVERTIRMLDSLKIAHTGTFMDAAQRANSYPLIVERNGWKLAVLNYTYGTNGIAVASPQWLVLLIPCRYGQYRQGECFQSGCSHCIFSLGIRV